MNIFKKHYLVLMWLLRSALLGVCIGIGCYAVFSVSVAIALSCLTHEQLQIKQRISEASDSEYKFPECALVSGSREHYASEGVIENSKTGSAGENFRLIYQIEAKP